MKNFLVVSISLALVATTINILSRNVFEHQKDYFSMETQTEEMKDFPKDFQPLFASNSADEQQTTVNVSKAELQYPLMLKITTSGDYLTGSIKINGKSIKDIKSNNLKEINLVPYLSKGNLMVEISGKYSPISSILSVELVGKQTTVTQQSSGSGSFRHNLLINVE